MMARKWKRRLRVKKKKRALFRSFKNKNPCIRWSRRILALILVGSPIIIIYIYGDYIFDKYLSSLHWDARSGKIIAMNQLAPDILSDDDDSSRTAKQKFIDQYQLMIQSDHELTDKASFENLKKLSDFLIDIQSNKKQYAQKYNDLKQRIEINEAYKSLFQSTDELIQTVTPLTVYQLNEQYAPIINQWLIQTQNKDVFAKRIQQLQFDLIKDGVNVDQLFSQANQPLVSLEKNKIIIKKDAYPYLKEEYETLKKQIKYKWRCLSFLDTIYQKIEDQLNQNLRRHTAYGDYILDMQEKEAAYQEYEWFKEYQRKEQERQKQQERLKQQLEKEKEQEQQKETSASTQESSNSSSEAANETQTSESSAPPQETITMLDFIGKSKTDIEQWADEHQLSIEFKYRITNDKKDTVLETKPAANETFPVNQPITVILSN